ncbi:MAG TPA: DUF1223 domain-containing protein [Candidatus Sulfopaludibacter sp.]|jgi:hypothetical protein|nr:DUF1223 domain-containing protein [Candidatus Sulfopaludibacter sp.]
MRKLIFASLCGAVLCAVEPTRAPILVELFTSEGCSSCPPADKVLEQLDPQVIVLSEHVDYWNQLGWKDPFSSHAFTQRQEAYARQLSTEGPYTPEMVVDGGAEFNGSDRARALQELNKASKRPKATIHLTRSRDGLQVDVADSPHAGAVFLALAENSAASQVAAGENNGRRLHHVAILQSLRKLGTVKKAGGFSQSVALPSPSQRVIVFVQEADLGPIYGAAIWAQ